MVEKRPGPPRGVVPGALNNFSTTPSFLLSGTSAIFFFFSAKLKRVEEGAIGQSNPLLGVRKKTPDLRRILGETKEPLQLLRHQKLVGQTQMK